MWELVKAFFICQTVKELYVKRHLALLVMLWGTHSLFRLVHFDFIFDYLPIWFAERIFISYSFYVIVTNLGISFVDYFLNFPVYTPLSNAVRRYVSRHINKLSSRLAETAKPTAPPRQTYAYTFHDPYYDSRQETTFPSLFGAAKEERQEQQAMPVNNYGIYSEAKPGVTDKPMGGLLFHHDGVNHDLQHMIEEGDRLAKEARQQTRLAPPLSFAPSILPPRPPAKRMDKTLWQLSRTEKMENDFREEQVELMNENWARVVNSDSRPVYRERLTMWLSSKIFHPLATGIIELEKCIAPHSLADCPPNMMAAIIYSNPKMMIIRDVVTIPGYDRSSNVRRHIFDRIKDLGSCNNLQSYCWINRKDELPSDDTILMHCFKTYMEYEMPNVVPPLIAEEGGVFLFLLVFFFITEELKDQIFHL